MHSAQIDASALLNTASCLPQNEHSRSVVFGEAGCEPGAGCALVTHSLQMKTAGSALAITFWRAVFPEKVQDSPSWECGCTRRC